MSTQYSSVLPSSGLPEPVFDQTLTPRPLPGTKNLDGRPIWEPLLFCYDELIGEEYEQKRKAYLKYTGDDVVKTTAIMDIAVEFNLLNIYCELIEENVARPSP